jgi:RimJ/RimL family protein N-acetyltransferase
MAGAAKGVAVFFRSKNLFLRPIWSEDLIALRHAITEIDFGRISAKLSFDLLPSGDDGRLPCRIITRPDRNGEQIIGIIGLFQRNDSVVLKIWIDPDQRGRGYGTEAIRGMTELAWVAGHATISADIPVGDVAMLRVLRKSGFQPDSDNVFPACGGHVLDMPPDHHWAWTGPEMDAPEGARGFSARAV